MNHLGSLVMKTEHLYLRPFVLKDAPGMYEIGLLILKI